MIIKAVDREWEINEITLKEKRMLKRLSARFASEISKQDGEGMSDGSLESFQDILDETLRMSGLEKIKEAHDLSTIDLDDLLQSVFEEYLGIDPSTSGD